MFPPDLRGVAAAAGLCVKLLRPLSIACACCAHYRPWLRYVGSVYPHSQRSLAGVRMCATPWTERTKQKKNLQKPQNESQNQKIK
jgi:hypothetical protein